MERAFNDVKAVFADYNKWDDYGIALPFKDFDLRNDERLIDFNGTSVPWYGSMTDVLERNIIPRCLRSWEGKTMPYSFYMRQSADNPARDIGFEKEALLRLGGLALVRLEKGATEKVGSISLEVEGVQSGIVVQYPPEACSTLLQDETMVPIMWRFHRYREGASDRHRMIATRFRRAAEYSVSRSPTSPESKKYSSSVMQPDALFAYVASQVNPKTPTAQFR